MIIKRLFAVRRTDILCYQVFLLLFLGMLTAFGPFVTDMYLSALPSMTGYFDASVSSVQLSLTFSMIGLAVGQLYFGPMSDKYGRKSVLMCTLLAFVASTVLCLCASGIGQFVFYRLLQGIAASGSIVISRSIATDLFEGRELAKILAIVGAINGIAPVLAPVVGGFMTEETGWQGIFAVLLAIGMVLAVACAFFRESLPRTSRVQGNIFSALSNFAPLMKNRLYMGYMLQLGFAQAALFANIASAPFIMQNHYGFSPMQFSVCFGLNAMAIVFSAASAAKFKRIENGTRTGGIGMMVFSVCEAVALFTGASFWVYELFMIGLLISLGICFTSSTTLAMDNGRQYSGSASALLGAVAFAFGGVVSPLVGIGNPLVATGIVFIVSAVCSLACIGFVSNKRK